MRCGVERQLPVAGHAVSYHGDMYLQRQCYQAVPAGKNENDNEKERNPTAATSTNSIKSQKYDI